MPNHIKIDSDVLTDAMRIRRLPGTVHSATGYICSLLTPEELNKPIKKLLIDCCDFITRERPGIPEMGNDRDPLGVKDKEKDGSGPTSFSTFITNEIVGTKLFIPILKYKEGIKYKKDIERLQKMYNIGDVYMLQIKDHIYAIFLKACQPKRLKKIMKQSHSSNKRQFELFGKTFMPFEMPILPIEVIKGKLTGDISKAHSKLIEALFGINIKINGIGSEQIRRVIDRKF